MTPTFLDLFAGCGGFSLGFVAAGFRCLDAIEIDAQAHATHVLNFGDKGAQRSARDIRDISAANYSGTSLTNWHGPDVIIGGPPCQPFTRVGRAKLREIARLADAHIHDRATLYEHYLRFVEELRPRAFVMENVPDLCSFNGRNVAEEIALSAEELGYVVRYALLTWCGTACRNYVNGLSSSDCARSSGYRFFRHGPTGSRFQAATQPLEWLKERCQ